MMKKRPGIIAKSIKRSIRALALAAALCLLAACGGGRGASGVAVPAPRPPSASVPGSRPSARPLRLGLVMPEGEHEFIALSRLHALDELEGLAAEGGFEYSLLSAGDAVRQRAAVESLLAENPDVVVLWPLNGEVLRPAAHAVLDAGVRLIIYDRLIDGFYPTAAIAQDYAAIGRWAGEYLLQTFAPVFAEGGEAAYLRFTGSALPSRQLSAGMDEVLAASGYAERFVQLRPDFICEWDAAEAARLMTEYLAAAPPEELERLRFIVAQGDEMVDGIADALAAWAEANPGHSLPLRLVCGLGGRRETLERFEGGGPFGARLLTYYVSPSAIRQALRLGLAAATGSQYNGADVTGQTFIIPTIEIDPATAAAYRLSREYAERYSV